MFMKNLKINRRAKFLVAFVYVTSSELYGQSSRTAYAAAITLTMVKKVQ